jgi:hypothetical protein
VGSFGQPPDLPRPEEIRGGASRPLNSCRTVGVKAGRAAGTPTCKLGRADITLRSFQGVLGTEEFASDKCEGRLRACAPYPLQQS